MNKKTLASACVVLALCASNPKAFAQEQSLSTAKLAPSIVTEAVAATVSKRVLIAKLKQLKFFTANFSQQVMSDSGEVIEESTGSIAISKPNLANWQILTPDELSIVSDGKSVWFYNPWIEQVSVYALTSAIARTPILLLTSNDESLWQQYRVEQKNNQQQETFIITAIEPNSQIKNLTLVFNSQQQGGQLTGFSFLDATGQLSHIKLSAFNDKIAPEPNLFNFVMPANTQVDDQR